jgi:hypothetical protein
MSDSPRLTPTHPDSLATQSDSFRGEPRTAAWSFYLSYQAAGGGSLVTHLATHFMLSVFNGLVPGDSLVTHHDSPQSSQTAGGGSTRLTPLKG